MRVANTDSYDLLNNPGSDGVAFTIWFQGCSVRCHDCHNKKLWNPKGGKSVTPYDIIYDILRQPVGYKDVVFLGGEPMEQDNDELLVLVDALDNMGFRIWLYTSYELDGIPVAITDKCYFIKTGPYDSTMKTGKFPASANQHVYMRCDDILTQIKGDGLHADQHVTASSI
jgi:anaerobic ribonucleoside-triphosphate reductase activating protein